MAWPLILGAVAQIGAGILGSNAASDDRRAASNARQEVLTRIDALQVPDIEKERLALEQFKVQGILEPEIEEVFVAPDTELQAIITDPRLKEAQYGGIEALSEISQGGLRAEDKARLAQAQQQAGIAARGRREASEQSLRRRGLGGSGLEVQAALDAEQAASERLGQEALQTGGLASERALQAVLQRSQLGGQIRGQEYGEQAASAQAQDRINQFNVNQRATAERRRVDAANAAAAANLQNTQRVSDSNVNTANRQQQYNKELQDKDYRRKQDKAALAAGALGGIAKGKQASGQATANQYAGVGSGIAKIGQTYQASLDKKKV